MTHRAARPSSRARKANAQKYGPEYSSEDEDRAHRAKQLESMTERAKAGLPLTKEKR